MLVYLHRIPSANQGCKPLYRGNHVQNILHHPAYPAGFAEYIALAAMSVSLEYKLVGTGWCECLLQVEDCAVTITGSYLSDPLHDFCAAVQSMLQGADTARFSFDEEPGEYRWILKVNGLGTAQLTILEFQELWGNEPDSAGSVLLDCSLHLFTLAQTLHDSMSRMLKEHGESGYLAKWVQHPFPTEGYRQLGKSLAAHNSFKPKPLRGSA